MSNIKLSEIRPKDIQDLTLIVPNIVVTLAYASTKNFTNQVVPGYHGNTAYLTLAASKSLKQVQSILLKSELSLFIFDAYRPQRSVDFFKDTWLKLPENVDIKEEYYPKKTKRQLFDEGFLALQSSHSSGSTVDLSILNLKENKLLDMGTIFDFFDETSFTDSNEISELAQSNRAMLKNLMEDAGFINYAKEWWHFRLAAGPYPDTIFNFDID